MSAINDFAFKIATVNGTGSASANSLLMQAIFRMGIPVSGKNVFPSNIQGLPTWYEMRVSKDGYTARPSDMDLVVALNPETYAKDVAAVRPGGYLLYDSSWPLPDSLRKEGITVLGVPFGAMCVETFEGDRARSLMRNISYAGALAALLRIDMEVISTMLTEKFSRKKALLESNFTAIKLGFDYAMAHFKCPLPFHLKPMDATKDWVLLDGNSACGLGAVFAGATVGAWYPITPSTSLMEAFKEFADRYRVDKATGQKKYCLIQAEDELAAAGMVLGAGWAGARAFTSTAGPGISLMGEFVGLGYYAEIPGVFVDVQRTGPSTGMPTRTQQSDLLSVAYLSHGDTKHLALFPANPEECFYMMVQAFDLAERFQTPTFLVTDLDIGMNDWMCRRLKWDDSYRPDRGKVLGAMELAEVKKFARYADTGGGVPARTLPGVSPKGAYFTRGSGHTLQATYTEDSDEYRAVMERLALKFKTAEEAVPEPEIDAKDGTIGIVSIGGCHAAVQEALHMLRAQNVAADYMRIKGFPFGKKVREFLAKHRRIFVVEQNRDAQLRSLLGIETGTSFDKMIPVLDYGGLPLTAGFVVSEISRQLKLLQMSGAPGAPVGAHDGGAMRGVE